MTTTAAGGEARRRRGARGRRFVVSGLVASLAAVALPGAPAGASSVLTEESFRGDAASTALWVAGGSGGTIAGWPGGACLTAGADTAITPLPGCGLPTPDAAGEGALRLTPAAGGRTGYALRNDPLPSSYGLDITFTIAQWGGTGADGMSFFITNGDTELTAPGGRGGALGYTSFPYYGTPGVAGALMGVGFDAYGGFGSSEIDGSGCSPAQGAGAQRVYLRGPGQGLDGYCLVAASGPLARPLTANTRADATRVVRIVIDPDSEEGQFVRVFIDGASVLEAPVPVEFTQASTFKFGFAASTGGVNNNHEVWGMDVVSVVPVPAVVEPDVDGDGIPGSLDTDIDGDGIPNTEDTDIDGDGIPNDQDPDIDGDGILNELDADADGDGVPNTEDADADGPAEEAPVVMVRPSYTG